MGLFDRLKEGLSKTKKGFVEKVETLFVGRPVDDQTLEELEEILIAADIGPGNAADIVDNLRERAEKGEIREAASH